MNGYSRKDYDLKHIDNTSLIIPLVGKIEVTSARAGENTKIRRF